MNFPTYTNPVYEGYLGDPFVLKHNGEYYAYGTGPDIPRVPVLYSTDLVRWRPLGEALNMEGHDFEALWAPEVAYDNGMFYMYYSAGGREGEGHRLRVATASNPAGPFEDSGRILTPDDPFAIDAHPFRDDDGRWYLYYCRDFLEPNQKGRVSTGIVVGWLAGMTRLAGERRTVVRPHADWQLYERGREWYGRVWDWYTVEGASVRKHDGRYYCFYSGGAWREPNYGVSYVVADHPMGPFAPEGAVEGPGVLQTLRGRVIGPGHASVTFAPDNVGEYLVYHAWDPGHTARQMRIDPLMWEGGRPKSSGPTLDPRPAPPVPRFRDDFDGPKGTPPDTAYWLVDGGDWRQEGGQLAQLDAGIRRATAQILQGASRAGYVFEANARLLDATDQRGRYGVYLDHGPDGWTLLTLGANGSGLWCDQEARGKGRTSTPLTPGIAFGTDSYHRLLVDARGTELEVRVDGIRPARRVEAPPATVGLGLLTEEASAAFVGVSLSASSEDNPLP